MHQNSPGTIIQLLAANAAVFRSTLTDVPARMIHWKPDSQDWCLLEIVCHLLDEEREDFRARVMSTLADPTQPWTPIDPQGWVGARRYMEQDFFERLEAFLTERAASINWLHHLDDPAWGHAYEHEVLGTCTAKSMLENWLAHDYLHLRQINRRQYGFLKTHAEADLRYAGDW
jgi:hypothetical protein